MDELKQRKDYRSDDQVKDLTEAIQEINDFMEALAI